MDTNVVSLRTGKPRPGPLSISTYSLLIGKAGESRKKHLIHADAA